MVSIHNMRNTKPLIYPYDIKVDRSSVLGNPFVMHTEKERDEVCERYKHWIHQRIAMNDQGIKQELNRLLSIWQQHKILRLFCWCSPKRCHAEEIANILHEMSIAYQEAC